MTLFCAVRLAARAHAGQARLDGTPYIEHPLAVLHILWDLSVDMPLNACITAVLHDVLEDTDITYENLLECTGSEVAAVIRVLTKDTNYFSQPVHHREKAYLERIRAATRTFPYALLIKLADRLHNIRTSDCLPEWRRTKLLKETEHLYLPLAERILFDVPPNLRIVYRRCIDQLLKALEDAAQSMYPHAIDGERAFHNSCIASV